MSSSKRKHKIEENGKSKRKKPTEKKQKMDAKVLAIALIFIMLFVSYVVIFAGQNDEPRSKNMVFYRDPEIQDKYTGNVNDINEDLSNIKMTVKDASSGSTNTTEHVIDGIVLQTDGNFICTYFDKNGNNKLDSEDEFVVNNAAANDRIEISLKSGGGELAYYTFDPFR
jgi:hypothetical protein